MEPAFVALASLGRDKISHCPVKFSVVYGDRFYFSFADTAGTRQIFFCKKMLKVAFYLIVFIFLALTYVRLLERKIIYYPSKIIEFAPSDVGLAYEDVFFKAQDGIELHGWFVYYWARWRITPVSIGLSAA